MYLDQLRSRCAIHHIAIKDAPQVENKDAEMVIVFDRLAPDGLQYLTAGVSSMGMTLQAA